MEAEVPFELRVVRVRWASPDRPLSVETAWSPIPVLGDGHGGYVADASAYPEVSPRRQGQLAVHAPGVEAPPELVLAGGKAVALKPVEGADGRTWWIEQGSWKQKGDGYHDAPTCRHAGTAHLRVGSTDLRIRISPPGFDEREFEELVGEFRNGLWQLILDPGSPVTHTARRADVGVSEEFLDAVRDHIRHAGHALDRPHLELREQPEQQRLARVRPTTRTFQELALRGAPRRVTGRGHAPSFNTPENRQLVGMISRLDRSLRAMRRAAVELAGDFQRRSDAATARAEGLNGWVRVAPERLAQEIAELEARLGSMREARERILHRGDGEERSAALEIRVSGQVEDGYGQVGFWSTLLAANGRVREESEGLKLVFSHAPDAVGAVFEKGERYVIRGVFRRVHQGAKNGRRWFICEVDALVEVSSSLERKLTSELRRLRREQRKLEANDYRRRLSTEEVQRQEEDRAAYLLQARRFQAAAKEWAANASTLEPLTIQTSRLLERAKELGISPRLDLTVTGSMTYVQNPDYRGALAAFRRALDAAGLDTTRVDNLFRLDEVGILDLPMVYERWCLLKIVRVLREEFGLLPEEAYRDHLLRGLAESWDSSATTTISFEGPKLKRDVVVEYQPRLQSGRTPDFILTVRARPDAPLVPEGVEGKGPFDEHRLVLDAKCKRFVPIASGLVGADLSDELEELIAVRRYDEGDGNRVFVVHPGPDPGSAESWSQYCRYGGGHFTPDPQSRPPWDEGRPDHRYGAVLVRPGALDPLVRLIVMHLYVSLDEPVGAWRRSPRFDPFCPACGGTELTEMPPPGQRPPRHHARWVQWCADAECQQMIVRNYCHNCKTHLWKLGGYWTFHETRALSPYNIKCPHCGSYMLTGEDEQPYAEPLYELE